MWLLYFSPFCWEISIDYTQAWSGMTYGTVTNIECYGQKISVSMHLQTGMVAKGEGNMNKCSLSESALIFVGFIFMFVLYLSCMHDKGFPEQCELPEQKEHLAWYTICLTETLGKANQGRNTMISHLISAKLKVVVISDTFCMDLIIIIKYKHLL